MSGPERIPASPVMTRDTYAAGIVETLHYKREDIAARRINVLAHADLAEKLTQPPIGYKQPEQWNGYIPPDTSEGRHNRSPRREALLELVDEARARLAKAS